MEFLTMLGFFLTTLATALSLLVVDLAAVAVGLVNSFVKPTLTVLSLPLNFLSLGLFSLVVNGICFWLAAVLVPGFEVKGLIAVLLGPIVLSFVNTFLSKYFAEREIGMNVKSSSGAT
jgi:putative membrane protein